MRTQCCNPPLGSAQCFDCPLTTPMYSQPYARPSSSDSESNNAAPQGAGSVSAGTMEADRLEYPAVAAPHSSEEKHSEAPTPRTDDLFEEQHSNIYGEGKILDALEAFIKHSCQLERELAKAQQQAELDRRDIIARRKGMEGAMALVAELKAAQSAMPRSDTAKIVARLEELREWVKTEHPQNYMDAVVTINDAIRALSSTTKKEGQ